MSRPDPRQEPAGLIVVGASVGGLAAAVMAADRGCRTIVVERGKELGGGAAPDAETIAASGSRFQRDAGVQDSPDRFAADILSVSRHHVEQSTNCPGPVKPQTIRIPAEDIHRLNVCGAWRPYRIAK